MDFWREILISLRRNKLRTILTGFSISWGIFILIVLLAAGNGLINGVSYNFESRLQNVYTLYSLETSLPYKGHKASRYIYFNDKDIHTLENGFPHIDKVSPMAIYNETAIKDDKSKMVSLEGVRPIYSQIEDVRMVRGRFINEHDEACSEKVIVIDEDLAKSFYDNADNAMGQFLMISGIGFKIVGVWKDESNICYVPFSTLEKIHNVTQYYRLTFTTYGLDTKEDNEQFKEYLKRKMAQLHEFSPNDPQGIWISSTMLNAIETNRIMHTLELFIWIIGIAMLISGIVGVSNIMRITVKERTNEIGIRKALGAKSRSILASIVTESMVITTLFGYIGMMAGILLTEIANNILNSKMDDNAMTVFSNFTVDVRIVVMATLLLVVCGVLAGFFPARKAVRVKPIEAMNYR